MYYINKCFNQKPLKTESGSESAQSFGNRTVEIIMMYEKILLYDTYRYAIITIGILI
jgi:hypothetical protein